MTKSYHQALKDAKNELEQLIQERQNMERRITAVKSVIAALNSATASTEQASPAEADLSGLGISDAIRSVLRDYGTEGGITTIQIRDALKSGNVDLDDYASPLTVVHNTLERLERQGQVISVRPDTEPGQKRAKTRWFLAATDGPEFPSGQVTFPL